MNYRIERHGTLIGEYDERRLRALVQEGSVRLTDVCTNAQKPGRPNVGQVIASLPLAEVEVRAARLSMGHGLAIAMIILCVLLTLLRHSRSTLQPAAGGPPPGRASQQAQAEHPGDPAETRPAGLPDAQPLAIPVLMPIVTPSLVAIIALDAQERPIRYGSGVVIEDGKHVATALSVVSGASFVELHYANGSVQRPQSVQASAGSEGLAIIEATQPAIPLSWLRETETETATAACYIAGNPLACRPPLSAATVSAATGMVQARAEPLPGSGVISPRGALTGLVIQRDDGVCYSSGSDGLHDLLSKGVPIRLDSPEWAQVAVHTQGRQPPPVQVDAVVAEGDQLLATFRSRDRQPATPRAALKQIDQVLVRVIYHELPAHEFQTASLEQRLCEVASTVSSVEADLASVDQGIADITRWMKPLDVAPSDWTAVQTAQLPESELQNGDADNPLAQAVAGIREAVCAHDAARVERAVSIYQRALQQIMAALEGTRRELASVALKQKQMLREATQRLEVTRRIGTAAVQAARQLVHHIEHELLEIHLQPGIPQQILLTAKPLTGLAAEVHVLDVRKTTPAE